MTSILLLLAASASMFMPLCTIVRYPLVRRAEHAALILEALPDTSFAQMWQPPAVMIAGDVLPGQIPFPVYAQAFRVVGVVIEDTHHRMSPGDRVWVIRWHGCNSVPPSKAQWTSPGDTVFVHGPLRSDDKSVQAEPTMDIDAWMYVYAFEAERELRRRRTHWVRRLFMPRVMTIAEFAAMYAAWPTFDEWTPLSPIANSTYQGFPCADTFASPLQSL